MNYDVEELLSIQTKKAPNQFMTMEKQSEPWKEKGYLNDPTRVFQNKRHIFMLVDDWKNLRVTHGTSQNLIQTIAFDDKVKAMDFVGENIIVAGV
jgi:hypothetical protein